MQLMKELQMFPKKILCNRYRKRQKARKSKAEALWLPLLPFLLYKVCVDKEKRVRIHLYMRA